MPSHHPIFTHLSNFPDYCSYILVDPAADNAILQFANGNGIEQLAKTVRSLRRGVYDNQLIQNAFNRGSLELRILKRYKEPVDSVIIKAEGVLAFNEFRFTDVTGRFVKRQYKLNTSVLMNYSKLKEHKPLVYITVKSKAVGAIVVGIFENMMEADEWKGKHYPGQTVTKLIFHDNEHTREYHKLKGYRLMRYREKHS